MKTYMQNGTITDTFLYDKIDSFCIREDIDDNGNFLYFYDGEDLIGLIESEFVSLYDNLPFLFFDDIDNYYFYKKLTPLYIDVAGLSSDCSTSKDDFNNFINTSGNNPIIFKLLYLEDCKFIVNSMQTSILNIEKLYIYFFKELCKSEPNINSLKEVFDFPTTIHEISENTHILSSILESIFIKSYSVLDKISKIAFEIENPLTDFSSYKKLRSSKIIWDKKGRLSLNEEAGSLFESCECLKIIESIRHEVIHNSSLEYDSKLFYKIENDKITEKFMLLPDFTNGNLSQYVNRKHFYSEENKINDLLPKIHIDFLNRLLKTLKLLNKIIKEKHENY